MIKDSGTRRDFGTGAVRDAAEGKGRMDLMPLDVIGGFFASDEAEFFEWIGDFINTNDPHFLYCAFDCGAELMFGDMATAILEVSIHMEEGCKKYGDRNWEKGIPIHNYIDSACRHYTKWCRGDEDEPHNRAALWNIMCAIWTLKHHPELNDLPNAHLHVAATEDEVGGIYAPFIGIPVYKDGDCYREVPMVEICDDCEEDEDEEDCECDDSCDCDECAGYDKCYSTAVETEEIEIPHEIIIDAFIKAMERISQNPFCEKNK